MYHWLTDSTYANQMNPMKVISTCVINSTQCLLHWSLWNHVRYVTLIWRDNDRTSRWRCPTSANNATLRQQMTPRVQRANYEIKNAPLCPIMIVCPLMWGWYYQRIYFSSTLSQTIHDLRLVYQGIFKVRTNYHSKSWGARPLHGFPTSFYWECDLVSTPARPWSQLNWFAHGLPTFGSDYLI